MLISRPEFYYNEEYIPVKTPPIMAQTPVRKCMNDLKDTITHLYIFHLHVLKTQIHV